MQAEEIIGEIGIHTQTLEGRSQRILSVRLDQPLAGNATLTEPECRLPHLFLHLGRRPQMERRDGLFRRAVYEKPLGHVLARDGLGWRNPAEQVRPRHPESLLA